MTELMHKIESIVGFRGMKADLVARNFIASAFQMLDQLEVRHKDHWLELL